MYVYAYVPTVPVLKARYQTVQCFFCVWLYVRVCEFIYCSLSMISTSVLCTCISQPSHVYTLHVFSCKMYVQILDMFGLYFNATCSWYFWNLANYNVRMCTRNAIAHASTCTYYIDTCISHRSIICQSLCTSLARFSAREVADFLTDLRDFCKLEQTLTSVFKNVERLQDTDGWICERERRVRREECKNTSK